jgi:hypothetical protein
MDLFLANIVVIVALGLLVLLRGRDLRGRSVHTARWLRILALIPLALQAGVFLLFGLGEMSGGDWSGAGHLLQLAVTVLLAALGWMRPLEGGVGIDAAGTIALASLMVSMIGGMPPDGPRVISPLPVALAAAQTVSGSLFFVAGVVGRKAALQDIDE